MSEQQPFDPRLKACMEEIKEIVSAYDVGAQVVIVSTTHSEFSYHFPTWSVAQLEEINGEMALRFNTKRHNFISNKSKRAVVEASVHLMAQFQHISAMFFDWASKIMDGLMESMEIENNISDTFHPHDLMGQIAARDTKNRPRRRR